MLPLDTTQPIPIRAVNVADHIDTRPLRVPEAISMEPLVLPQPGGGLVVVLRYGAAVFFGVSVEVEARFLKVVVPYSTNPVQTQDREEVQLRVRADTAAEGPEREGLAVRDLTLEKVLVIAEVLGASVALADLESRVAHGFERVEPMASDLGRNGKLMDDQRELFRHIGRALLVEHAMVARVQVNEKPDVLWDHPELEGLYLRLENEYDLKDRSAILDRRVELLSRTASTVLGLAQNRASMRGEWIVIALIMLEIVLTLGGIWGWWGR